jgi:hypothetical protein
VSPPLALAVSVIVSLCLSTSVSAVMLKPLRGVLSQLCPGNSSTTFWLSFTTLMLFVAPLLFTMLFEGSVIGTDPIAIVRTALASSLFGAFAALLVVGYQIARARPSSR